MTDWGLTWPAKAQEKKRMKSRVYSEDAECCALIEWRDKVGVRIHPELELLIHIPNGGRRNAREGARFKRMGVRPGVSDYFLPVAVPGYHGLWFEMKAPKGGRVTAAQVEWLSRMRDQDYRAEVCQGWADAKDLLLEYLAGEEVNHG